MDPSQQTAARIFEEAIQTPRSEARAKVLEAACGGDRDLRQLVEELLEAYDQAGEFLEQPPLEVHRRVEGSSSAVVSEVEGPNARIACYRLVRKLGEGGCGVVYLAEQEQPLRRQVALKIIKLGMDTRQVIARFEAERQALAMMDHPNIARVFDAGTTETGRPYFAMELVQGVKLTEYCDQHRLSTEDRLKLLTRVCYGIQHAHQKGIIHRDIKPSNILVAVHDDVPVPKVIDFGIAKATTGHRLTDKTLVTAVEQFLGTPGYMSPEQAGLGELDIDTRTDIYSLGVLLYELLTGVTPFDTTELLAAGLDEVLRTIREREPVRPSTRLGTMLADKLAATARSRQTEVPRLIHQVCGDLDWIVMRCLEKDRDRRYESVASLALDLERHLKSEPVVARPPSTLYWFQKLVRRNKLAFIAGGAVAAALIAGLVLSTWLFVRERQAARRASKAEAERGQEVILRQAQMLRMGERADGWSSNSLALLRDAGKVPITDELRVQAAATLVGLDVRLAKDFREFGASHFAFDAQGGRLLMDDSDSGPVKLWDLRGDRPTALGSTNDGPVWFDREGRPRQLACREKGIWLLNPEAGTKLREFRFNEPGVEDELGPCILTVSADSALCAAAVLGRTNRTQGRLAVWEVATGRLLKQASEACTTVAFSPDNACLATGDDDGWVCVRAMPDLSEPTLFHQGRARIHCLAFARDLSRPAGLADDRSWLLAAGDAGGVIRLYQLADKRLMMMYLGSAYDVYAVAFCPDHMTLASSGREHVRFWDIATGRQLVKVGGTDFQMALAFTPDGRSLAVGRHKGFGKKGIMNVMEIDSSRGILSLRGLSSQSGMVAFSHDGKRLAALAHNWEVGLWNLSSNCLERIFQAPKGIVADNAALAFSRDNRHLAFATREKAVLWDTETGREVESWTLPPGLNHRLCFNSAGRLLHFQWEGTAASEAGVCCMRELLRNAAANSARILWTNAPFDGRILHSALARDGKFVVVYGAVSDTNRPNGVVNVFEAVSGAEQPSLPSTYNHASWAMDPSASVFAVWDDARNDTAVFDLTGGKVVLRHPTRVDAISPGGRWLANAEYYGPGVRITRGDDSKWSLRLGIDLHASYLAQFSPDGRKLAWGTSDGTVYICDIEEVIRRLEEQGLGWK